MNKKLLKIISILTTAIVVFSMAGCESGGGSNVGLFGKGKKEFSVNSDIPASEVKKFFYTYENINYDAKYQRYLFYTTEKGDHFFFHETREKPGDYGWLTSEDTTKIGTVLLTDEEWIEFYNLINEGTVTERVESADSGGSGPWYYLYWTKDKDKYQEYSFTDYDKKKAFEKYCINLAENPVALSIEEYPPFDESYCGKWMGYPKNVSGEYHMTLEQPVNNEYPVSINFVWMSSGNSGDGMNIDDVEITGNASLNEDGIMILSGTLNDGSDEDEKPFKAALSTTGSGIKMTVLDCYTDRIFIRNEFDFERE